VARLTGFNTANHTPYLGRKVEMRQPIDLDIQKEKRKPKEKKEM
jgi:hypothetical protein